MLLRWLAAALLCLVLPHTALAATEIEISSPGEQSIPLGLTKFLPDQGARSDRIADEFNEVLVADLDLSGLFRFVDPQSFLDDAGRIGLFSNQVNFPQWRLLGSETLIKGTYRLDGDELVVEGRLFDVVNRRLLTGRRYVGQTKDVRRMAHAFADLVLKELTGEEGPFSSRIAYVSDQSGDKELWLMDVDGKRPLRLTNHRSIVLNPDFSPRGKEILFTSYRANNPDLYRKEIYTGKEAKLSYKPGLNVAGRMSPDEREVKGTKRAPGPLYGLKAHAWSALAVAVVGAHPEFARHRERQVGGAGGMAVGGEPGDLRDAGERPDGLAVGEPGVVVADEGEVAEAVRHDGHRQRPPSSPRSRGGRRGLVPLSPASQRRNRHGRLVFGEEPRGHPTGHRRVPPGTGGGSRQRVPVTASRAGVPGQGRLPS